MAEFQNDAIFWIEVEKIKPNPYQPRREFDEAKLKDLSDSIRQYGVLQPLVATRQEVQIPDGGMVVEYELIAGERRLRASKLAGLSQVPVIIRRGAENAREKLELAIIENLQREDINAVDRARAFDRLIKEFGFNHTEIGKRMGKSREYVSNTIRILSLPEEILKALEQGKITDGHTRPLLTLSDRPQEQMTLFKEIVLRKMTVREAERLVRRIAVERVRNKDYIVDPETLSIEEKLTETLGTRVQIERKQVGGKISINFFSNEDLQTILDLLNRSKNTVAPNLLERHEKVVEQKEALGPIDDRTIEEIAKQESELYSVSNFSV